MIRTILSFCIFLLGFTGGLQSQNFFTLVSTPVTNMGNSAAAWGDYDRDGDLDLVLAGESASSPAMTKLFRNDAGAFTDANAGLPGIHFGSLDWADYDQDGDLDLLIAGQDSTGIPVMKIMRNKDGNFAEVSVTLPGIYYGEAAWGDYDNDGDPDILMSGIGTDGLYYTRILRNDSPTSFTDIGAVMTGFQSASVSWVDYNNDGQPDACVSGDSGGGIYTDLYRNENGTFTKVAFDFVGLGNGDVRWADLDNDGDADMVECGMDIYVTGYVYAYRNDGNDQFTLIDAVSNNLISSSLDIGDYNNDGLLDFMVIGVVPACGGAAVSLLYENAGGMNFIETSTLLPGFKNGTVRWGDYNNDGWSDLFFTGYNSNNDYTSDLYRNLSGNSSFSINTPPDLPSGLVSEVSGNAVTLSWNPAGDAQTPSGGLFYNIFIGTSPTASDVLSPLSDLTTGFPRIISTGNTGHDTAWTIGGLDPGTYYWSVQTLDNGFMGSVFPPAVSFTITMTGMTEPSAGHITITPNPVTDHICISLPEDVKNIPVRILSGTGQVVREIRQSASFIRVETTNLPSGIYIVTAGDLREKFIVR